MSWKSNDKRWAVAVVSMCMAVAVSGKSYTDYPEWEMLPKVDCWDDWETEAAWQRLVARGEAAHEAMMAVIRECDDVMLARAVLNKV